VRRGQIWWAEFEDIGRHAVVLLSRDATYRIRTQATVALITSRIRGIAVEVPVGPREGLDRDSVINVDNVATIDLATLTQFVSSLSSERMLELERALHFALGLSY
jgi:mRNA interferase MazF